MLKAKQSISYGLKYNLFQSIYNIYVCYTAKNVAFHQGRRGIYISLVIIMHKKARHEQMPQPPPNMGSTQVESSCWMCATVLSSLNCLCWENNKNFHSNALSNLMEFQSPRKGCWISLQKRPTFNVVYFFPLCSLLERSKKGTAFD